MEKWRRKAYGEWVLRVIKNPNRLNLDVSGASFMHPNMHFSTSTWPFSGQPVWMSHM
jgi:hypothetical protein